MKINNRQKLLTILAAVVVSIWAADRMVLTPLTNLWKERATKIAELKKSITQGKSLVERDEFIRSRWEGMRTNTLPAEVSIAENEVLKAFERWSQNSRISITSIRPQWKRNADDYMTLECRADAFGDMRSLTRFLYDLEQDPLALKVDLVEITSNDNNGQQLSLGVQVSGLMLHAEEP